MRIGFVSMPITGHLNPMTALARKLESRGNEVVFFGVPDAEQKRCDFGVRKRFHLGF